MSKPSRRTARDEGSASEGVRTWLQQTNSSSELLMETLAKARGLNEIVIKQLQLRAKHQELGDADAAYACGTGLIAAARGTIAVLRQFEEQVPQNIQEDHASGGCEMALFWFSGRSRSRSTERAEEFDAEPPPRITSSGGMNCRAYQLIDELFDHAQ